MSRLVSKLTSGLALFQRQSSPRQSSPRKPAPRTLAPRTTGQRALRQIAMMGLAMPLALGLLACHKADGAGTPGDTVAAVAPPHGKSWSEIVAPTPDGGMIMGNPKAPIKLLEYGSLSCPHCAHLANEGMAKLIGTYVNSGRVSYEYRSFAIHGIDIPLTVLARCADKSAFFGLVEQLYANQESMLKRAMDGQAQVKASESLPPNQRLVAVADAYGLTQFFSARGVPVAKAHACLANTASAVTVAKQAETWGNSGIDSTPTLIINGTRTTALAWPDLEAALKAAGAR